MSDSFWKLDLFPLLREQTYCSALVATLSLVVLFWSRLLKVVWEMSFHPSRSGSAIPLFCSRKGFTSLHLSFSVFPDFRCSGIPYFTPDFSGVALLCPTYLSLRNRVIFAYSVFIHTSALFSKPHSAWMTIITVVILLPLFEPRSAGMAYGELALLSMGIVFSLFWAKWDDLSVSFSLWGYFEVDYNCSSAWRATVLED